MTRQPRFDFDRGASPPPSIEPSEALRLDLDGYEGPLHVLLELARRQKIDLLQISIADLADQYLAFVQAAPQLELAADYLVMAAWLAELKSRLLLPRAAPSTDAPAAQEAAAALAHRLSRLEALRVGAEALRRRPQMGIDVFTAAAGPIEVVTTDTVTASLHGLLRAYVSQRRRPSAAAYAPQRRVDAMPLAVAREHLEGLSARLTGWTTLGAAAPAAQPGGPTPESRLASTLAAVLELVREARLEVRQEEAFAPLYVRARA